MRRANSSSLAVLLFLASVVSAQAPPPIVSISTRADGKGQAIVVMNTAKTAITAVFMQVTGPGDGLGLVQKDYAFLPSEKPIEPGETRVVQSGLGMAMKPELKAVLFYNGAFSGDAAWVAASNRGREVHLEAIDKVLQLVGSIRAGRQTAQGAVQELNGTLEAMRQQARQEMQSRGRLLPFVENAEAQTTYQSAIEDLTGSPRGATSGSLEDRLRGLESACLKVRQKALESAPELAAAPKAPNQ